ncbi:unnamed protein product [Spirodela intermedia]|uniref:Uncharacterized protein n=1 Tax=Spirodela intermedia TaxID=51605 RepID=A0A7I8IFJ1_SPIIN|nr:unnamed protein product [Spirodela intermedia]CAA6656598.1 unnamed protein product [Spirodela intermedia]
MCAMECQSCDQTSQKQNDFLQWNDTRSSKGRSDYDDCRDFQMKIDLPNFDGHLKIEEFLDWIFKGSRFVIEYIEKFYRLSSRVDLTEFESYMIFRFKSGLRWDIEEKVALQSFFKLNDVVMASEHAEVLLEKGKL